MSSALLVKTAQDK